MDKIIIHNKANITNSSALSYAYMTLNTAVNELEKVGDYRLVEFYGLVKKGEIIKRKTCYTIVIS